MTEYIRLKTSNCQNCYKCIRNCPVKSIRFSGNQAHIVNDECIFCGHCLTVCPQNAKYIRDDTEIVKTMIARGEHISVSIAPSFIANYPNVTIKAMENALKQLGFSAVEETAIGATAVKQKYDEIINKGEQKVIISSCCHSVNLLIRKYFPETLSCLARVVSPMAAHCKMLKEKNPNTKTVFIGPCISKKAEAEEYKEYIDCALTFEELTRWLNEENITFDTIEDINNESKARLFPIAGGILKSMECSNPDYTYITVDGVEKCIKALTDIKNGELENVFIEMSVCIGSCIGGPAMERNHHSLIRDNIVIEKYAGDKDFSIINLDEEEIKHEHRYIGTHSTMPSEREIKEILKKMGKTLPEHELDCGTCGYNTCREKAIAVYHGKADLSMCLPFLKEKAENFSDNIIKNTPNAIIVMNESLEIQQINKAALKLMNINAAPDVLGDSVVRILPPQDFVDILNSSKRLITTKQYLSEYNCYVEKIIVYDKSYHLIICIMRDITDEERSKAAKNEVSRQAIEITNEIIQKQMRSVQEIASLLGETTAETQVALTRLKESLSYD